MKPALDFLKILRFSFPVPVVGRRKHKKNLPLALRAREKIWVRLVGKSRIAPTSVLAVAVMMVL